MKVVVMEPPNRKAMTLLAALAESFERRFGTKPTIRRNYAPCDLLIVYGAGNPKQWPAFEQHVASGKMALNWDAAYWRRGPLLQTGQHYRVSINAVHPTTACLDATPADRRFDQYGIRIATQRSHGDHVLLIGLGHKSRRSLGYRGTEWEEATLNSIRKAIDLPVVYRAKCRENHLPDETLPGCETTWYKAAPIDVALAGAEVVVCRHSNVGVDAAIAGVPCITEAGASHWLWRGNTPGRYRLRSYSRRLNFIRRLAHWQWSIAEAQRGDPWPFIMEQIK